MIRTLLIANRGEIACRIMRTCRRLGIRSVAVYSDADRDALHVATADQAIRIGPAEAARSYLSVDAILDAARRTGADAIHPGYGFLSERAALPEACAANGVAWVGPSADAIRRMGSKIESKRIAAAAGVASVPGYHGAAQDQPSLMAAAERIGFPVLIKASAGGGGRGMRRVHSAADLPEALTAARAEAQAGFGDPSLLLERLILRPRHLEVQLAGDTHGNLVHLFERECSIQRNYQKVIEEAPAPNLSPQLRAALFEAALKLGRAIGYDSLGTVEFVLDADSGEGPFFLEMNTRLQVEHPVTEAITGLDLVEWQIRIAQGETLPLRQDELMADGAAIEARLNAEDPAQAYRPCIGRVLEFLPPDGVRVDTGVKAGATVTPHYDSLLAKIIAHGADRADAARRLSSGLGDLALLGVGSNQAFLRDIVDHPVFRAGDLTTAFLHEAFPEGWTPNLERRDFALAAALLWAERLPVSASPGPWSTLGGFRLFGAESARAWTALAVEGEGATSRIALSGRKGRWAIRSGEAETNAESGFAGSRFFMSVDGKRRLYAFAVDGDHIWVGEGGRTAQFRIRPWIETAGRAATVAAAGGNQLRAPMPGQINAMKVEPGQAVLAGETLAVLEAMKLLYALPAPASGRVTSVYAQTGDTVAAGAVLVEIAASDPPPES